MLLDVILNNVRLGGCQQKDVQGYLLQPDIGCSWMHVILVFLCRIVFLALRCTIAELVYFQLHMFAKQQIYIIYTNTDSFYVVAPPGNNLQVEEVYVNLSWHSDWENGTFREAFTLSARCVNPN